MCFISSINLNVEYEFKMYDKRFALLSNMFVTMTYIIIYFVYYHIL